MSTEYTLRDYCEETDFAILFEYWNELNIKTLGHLVSGVSPCIPEERAREELRKMERRYRYPFIIADSNNLAIGCVAVHRYIRISRRHDFYITLWDRPELMEQILRETLGRIFDNSIVEMAVCIVPGYEELLVEACRRVGMEEVGCIPDYEVCNAQTYPQFTFILRKADWVKLNNKGNESNCDVRNPFEGLSAWYVWSEVLWYMKERLSGETVTAWFDEVKVEDLTRDKVVVSTTSDFRCEIIQRRCVPYIQDALKELYHAELEVVVYNRDSGHSARK